MAEVAPSSVSLVMTQGAMLSTAFAKAVGLAAQPANINGLTVEVTATSGLSVVPMKTLMLSVTLIKKVGFLILAAVAPSSRSLVMTQGAMLSTAFAKVADWFSEIGRGCTL